MTATDRLAEAGLLRQEPFSVEGMEIMSGWLVESAGEHTCGAGGSESGYAHEPGCGYVPIQRLDDLPGWPGAQHQADVEQLGHSIIALLDRAERLRAQMARLTEERAAECIGNAFERRASDPTVRDAARRVVAMVQAEPQEAQIATQAPAEQPQPASGGNRTGGGSWVPQTGAETLRAIEENAPRFVAALEAAGFVVSLAQPADPVDEHDHRWVEQTTYADSARGVTISACTVPGCPAVLETRA